MNYQKYLALFGASILALKFTNTFFDIVRSVIRRKEKIDLTKFQGSYAIITGGANGIGRAFAFDLAKKRINLIILDVDQEALNNMQFEIQSKYNVVVVPIQFDVFQLKDQSICEKLVQGLQHLDISILINNVGVSFGAYGFFHRIPIGLIGRSFEINFVTFVVLTRLFAQKLKSRQDGHLLLNICSAASYQPIMYSFQYCSTKAAMDIFTQSLRLEGYNAIALKPFFVSTRLVGFAKGPFIIEPEDLVDSFWNDTSLETGHWKHRLEVQINHLFPTWVLKKLQQLMESQVAEFSTREQEKYN